MVSQAILRKRYDYGNFTPSAPYGLFARIGRGGRYYDGACKRGIGTMANSGNIGQRQLANAALSEKGSLRATKDIKHGREILVKYGADYHRGTHCPSRSKVPCLIHRTYRR